MHELPRGNVKPKKLTHLFVEKINIMQKFTVSRKCMHPQWLWEPYKPINITSVGARDVFLGHSGRTWTQS